MGRQLSFHPGTSGTGAGAAGPIVAHLFGRFEITSPEGLPLELNCAKSRELLAYLLVHWNRAHRRETVTELLWGERCRGDPRKLLRQALWRLQTVLTADPNGGVKLIETLGPEWVRVNPAVPLTLDLADFEQAWGEFEKPPAPEDSETRAQDTARALDLYRGDLLDGEDWGWCLLERERLRSMFLVMSDRITAWCARNGEVALGVRLASKTLQDDPAHEKTHRNLMRLYALIGDRTSALRQFESCVAALRAELDVEPSRETQELCDLIRSDRPVLANGMDPSANGNSTLSSQAFGALEGLRELRNLLGKTRKDVDLEIEALERALAEKK